MYKTVNDTKTQHSVTGYPGFEADIYMTRMKYKNSISFVIYIVVPIVVIVRR